MEFYSGEAGLSGRFSEGLLLRRLHYEPDIIPTLNAARNAIEIKCIRRALLLHDSNVKRAAQALGVSRNTLYRLAERHSIPLR